MNKAFSLIELMVVVAIIAILAAVAVPAYKNYIIASRALTAMPVIDRLMSDSIAFASEHGRFAFATDFGLSTFPDNNGVDNPQALDPYFVSVLMQDDLPNTTTCGQEGTIFGYLDPALLGFDSSVTQFSFRCYMWNNEGVVSKFCFYEYGGTNSGTDNLIPGMINANTTANWDQSLAPNYSAGYLGGAPASFLTSTCM